jgi:glutamate/tyrosine decarboxylase-like PLP-dependent enzyme
MTERRDVRCETAGAPSPAQTSWHQRMCGALRLDGPGGGIPEGWFLGPRAENLEIMRALLSQALDSHAAFRRGFHPEDPSHLTPSLRESAAFRESVERLQRESAVLFEALQQSLPFASMRYQGHMLWDQAMPATIGQFAAMLYNQNNVAAEASPVTTRLEIEVGRDLCRMLGFRVPEADMPVPGLHGWGHITSGGSVANIEGLWAARNLCFAAVGLRAALREVPALAAARNIEVPHWDGTRARLTELDTWTLLNLDLDAVAALPAAVAACGVAPELLTRALGGYAVQNTGLVAFYRSFMHDVPEPPVLLVPATAHYSWAKAATLCGLGQNAALVQRVDRDARLDLDGVEESLATLRRRRVPVLCVVGVVGSTEESAVDPIAGLLALRTRFRERGLNFAIHADAAWGGYFRSMLGCAARATAQDTGSQIPALSMSPYVEAQYRAVPEVDFVTVDPHKGGYVPYPAGAICYRNVALREAISLKAPVVFHEQTEESVGVYGLEGSRPGSAAAAVWLAHRVIRPDPSGYGRILGQCMWTSRRLACRLLTLDDPRFAVTLFNMTPAERDGGRAEEIAAERARIRAFAAMDNDALVARLRAEPADHALFSAIGSDQVILAFALNPRSAHGLNRDRAQANAFNRRVFHHCSRIAPDRDIAGLDLILTSSAFDPRTYGRAFVDGFASRIGLVPDGDAGVDFLIWTTMDPWLTETEGGDFLGTLVEGLRRAAHRALDELGLG